MDLTDQQWDVIRPFIPDPEADRTREKGGLPWRDPRDVLNGILWVLRTGAPWADLPRRYPPPQNCHRRFQKWVKEGVLEAVLRGLAEDLRTRGKLDLTEAYVDGSHAGAKRGPSGWENSPRQGDQDHGSGRPPWPSSRRWDCEWSAE